MLDDLMFKFWELSAINCCGTHLCSRQPQLRFRRSNARRREYLEQPLELIAVADFGIGTRRNGVRQFAQCRNLQRESPFLRQRPVRHASTCAHPGTRRWPSNSTVIRL